MKKSDAIFIKLNSFILVFTFFFLWISVYFEDRVEDVFAYILIFSFGILHGANDLKLLQSAGGHSQKTGNLLRMTLYYVLFVLGSAALFYFFPLVALLWFVIFSAYHFGEQHWVNKVKQQTALEKTFFTVYGLCILLSLFLAHHVEVSDIIDNITGFWPSVDFYTYPLYICIFIFVLIYGILIQQKKIDSKIAQELFFLLVFYIVFNTASLIWAFAIYFILWHSLPSLADQMKYLYGSISKRSFFKYLKSSSIYWGISVLGLALLFLIFKDSGKTTLLSFFFSFLAAITFPHVLVISKLNRR
ncbi:MAG: Brp/Blh family beta-carotene 15,15'-dioxygenase [Bacteroidota bacterium]